jgi:hypothetical protein
MRPFARETILLMRRSGPDGTYLTPGPVTPSGGQAHRNWISAIASWARRLGRNPYEHGLKSASKMQGTV